MPTLILPLSPPPLQSTNPIKLDPDFLKRVEKRLAAHENELATARVAGDLKEVKLEDSKQTVSDAIKLIEELKKVSDCNKPELEEAWKGVYEEAVSLQKKLEELKLVSPETENHIEAYEQKLSKIVENYQVLSKYFRKVKEVSGFKRKNDVNELKKILHIQKIFWLEILAKIIGFLLFTKEIVKFRQGLIELLKDLKEEGLDLTQPPSEQNDIFWLLDGTLRILGKDIERWQQILSRKKSEVPSKNVNARGGMYSVSSGLTKNKKQIEVLIKKQVIGYLTKNQGLLQNREESARQQLLLKQKLNRQQITIERTRQKNNNLEQKLKKSKQENTTLAQRLDTAEQAKAQQYANDQNDKAQQRKQIIYLKSETELLGKRWWRLHNKQNKQEKVLEKMSALKFDQRLQQLEQAKNKVMQELKAGRAAHKKVTAMQKKWEEFGRIEAKAIKKIERLNKQIKDLQTKLEKLASQESVTNLQQRLVTLEEAKTEADKQAASLKEQIKDQRTELDRLKAQQRVDEQKGIDEAKVVQNQINTLESKISSLQDELKPLHEAQKDRETIVKEIKELKQQLEPLKQKKAKVEQQLEAAKVAQGAFTAVQQRVEALEEAKTEADKQAASLKEQIKDQRTELDRLKAQQRVDEQKGIDEAKAVQDRNNTLESKISSLQDELKPLHEAQKDQHSILEKIGAFDQQLKRLEQEKIEVNKKLEAMQVEQETITAIQQRLKVLEDDKAKASEQIESLSKSIGEQQTQLEKQQQAMAEAKEDLGRMQQEREELLQRNTTIESAVSAIQLGLTTPDEKQKAQEAVTAIQQRLNVLEDDKAQASKQIESLSKSIGGQQTKLEEQQRAMAGAKEELGRMQQEREKLLQRNTTTENTLSTIQLALSTYSEEKANAQERIDTLESQTLLLQEQSKKLSEEQKNQETIVKEIKELKQQLEAAKVAQGVFTAVQQRVEALEEAKTEADKRAENLNEQIKDQRAELEQLKAQQRVDEQKGIDDAKATLEQRQQEKEELLQRNSSIKDEISAIRSELESLSKKQGNHETTLNEIGKLNQRLQLLEEEKDKVNQQLEAAKVIQEEIATAQQKLVALEEAKTEADKQAESLSEQIKDQRVELGRLGAQQKADQQKGIDEAKAVQDRNNTLESKISSLQDELKALHEKQMHQEAIVKEINELKQQLEQLKPEKTEVNRQLEAAKVAQEAFAAVQQRLMTLEEAKTEADKRAEDLSKQIEDQRTRLEEQQCAENKSSFDDATQLLSYTDTNGANLEKEGRGSEQPDPRMFWDGEQIDESSQTLNKISSDLDGLFTDYRTHSKHASIASEKALREGQEERIKDIEDELNSIKEKYAQLQKEIEILRQELQTQRTDIQKDVMETCEQLDELVGEKEIQTAQIKAIFEQVVEQRAENTMALALMQSRGIEIVAEIAKRLKALQRQIGTNAVLQELAKEIEDAGLALDGLEIRADDTTSLVLRTSISVEPLLQNDFNESEEKISHSGRTSPKEVSNNEAGRRALADEIAAAGSPPMGRVRHQRSLSQLFGNGNDPQELEKLNSILIDSQDKVGILSELVDKQAAKLLEFEVALETVNNCLNALAESKSDNSTHEKSQIELFQKQFIEFKQQFDLFQQKYQQLEEDSQKNDTERQNRDQKIKQSLTKIEEKLKTSVSDNNSRYGELESTILASQKKNEENYQSINSNINTQWAAATKSMEDFKRDETGSLDGHKKYVTRLLSEFSDRLDSYESGRNDSQNLQSEFRELKTLFQNILTTLGYRSISVDGFVALT